MKADLVFRADADSRIGSGHAMRCLALAAACIAHGARVAFLGAIEPEPLRRRITGSGARLEHLPADAPLGQGGAHPLVAGARVVVVDSYRFDGHDLHALRSPERRVAFIDDLARLAEYPVDLLVNQNFGAERARYNAPSATRRLLGARFALLRPEFAARRDWRRDTAGRAARVLVTLGGASVADSLALALRSVARLPGPLELRVLAPADRDAPAVSDACRLLAARGHSVSLQPFEPDMPGAMAWADLALAAAGSTSLELAYMQLPAVLLELSDDQAANAAGAPAAGCAVSLGRSDSRSEERIAAALADLAADPAVRRRMAERGRAAVDGLGPERVAVALEELLR